MIAMTMAQALPPPHLRPIQRFNTMAIIAILLLALLFTAYSIFDRQQVFGEGENTAKGVAEYTAVVAEGTLDTTRQMLRTMTLLAHPVYPKTVDDPARVRKTLLKLKDQHPHIMDLLIIDAGGRIEHWTGNGEPPTVLDREYYTAHLNDARQEIHVTPPLLSKVHINKWFFALSEAVRDGQGKLIHVLVAIVDVGILHERMSVQLAISGSSQALLAEDGSVYARNPGQSMYVGKKVSRPRELGTLISRQTSITFVADSQLDNTERILTFHRLKNFPITAVGTVIVDELLAKWRFRASLLGLFWLLLGTGIILLARRANAIAQKQHTQAVTDDLTGVSDRRSILHTALILEAKNHHQNLSLLMIDVDNLKTINNHFGHRIGDGVLRRVAAMLNTHCRPGDSVGRYNGDQFLVLMPDTTPEDALPQAEKIRQWIENRLIDPAPVTVSIGVVTTSVADLTLDHALTRADAALFRAKSEGKNRVRVAIQS